MSASDADEKKRAVARERQRRSRERKRLAAGYTPPPKKTTERVDVPPEIQRERERIAMNLDLADLRSVRDAIALTARELILGIPDAAYRMEKLTKASSEARALNGELELDDRLETVEEVARKQGKGTHK